MRHNSINFQLHQAVADGSIQLRFLSTCTKGQYSGSRHEFIILDGGK
jgi:hypothetical protein